MARGPHGSRYPAYQSKRASARRRVNVSNEAYSFSNWESDQASTSHVSSSKAGPQQPAVMQWAQAEASVLPPIRA